MTFRIELTGTDFSFESFGRESLLESALNAGIPVAYGCSNGNCGDCAARLVSGDVSTLRHSDYVFSQADREAGKFLLCTHTAASDLRIDTLVATNSTQIPKQHIDVKIKKVRKIDDRVVCLDVQTPRTSRLRFLAGQWAELSEEGGIGCSLPIASCPCDDRNIQFHIPLTGEYCDKAEHLLGKSRGSVLQLNGPNGDFVLNQSSSLPRLMIGSGFGFPPLKSIIEHSLSLTPEIAIDLMWLEPPEQLHYMDNHMRMWDDALDNFTLHRFPCVALNGEQPSPEAITLLMHLLETPRDVYLAGPEQLGTAVNNMLAHCDASVSPFHQCVI